MSDRWRGTISYLGAEIVSLGRVRYNTQRQLDRNKIKGAAAKKAGDKNEVQRLARMVLDEIQVVKQYDAEIAAVRERIAALRLNG